MSIVLLQNEMGVIGEFIDHNNNKYIRLVQS